MSNKKSPSGSIFPYYYKDGELFGTNFDGYDKSREDELVELMKAEKEFIIKQSYPLPFWTNFYNTKLTNRILVEFVSTIDRLQKYMPKIAIVGCSSIDKWRLGRITKKLNVKISSPIRYFSDPEEAKSWLVGKHEKNNRDR